MYVAEDCYVCGPQYGKLTYNMFFFFNLKVFNIVCVRVRMCHMCTGAHRGQKKGSESQVSLSTHVLRKNSQCLLLAAV